MKIFYHLLIITFAILLSSCGSSSPSEKDLAQEIEKKLNGLFEVENIEMSTSQVNDFTFQISFIAEVETTDVFYDRVPGAMDVILADDQKNIFNEFRKKLSLAQSALHRTKATLQSDDVFLDESAKLEDADKKVSDFQSIKIYRAIDKGQKAMMSAKCTAEAIGDLWKFSKFHDSDFDKKGVQGKSYELSDNDYVVDSSELKKAIKSSISFFEDKMEYLDSLKNTLEQRAEEERKKLEQRQAEEKERLAKLRAEKEQLFYSQFTEGVIFAGSVLEKNSGITSKIFLKITKINKQTNSYEGEIISGFWSRNTVQCVGIFDTEKMVLNLYKEDYIKDAIPFLEWRQKRGSSSWGSSSDQKIILNLDNDGNLSGGDASKFSLNLSKDSGQLQELIAAEKRKLEELQGLLTQGATYNGILNYKGEYSGEVILKVMGYQNGMISLSIMPKNDASAFQLFHAKVDHSPYAENPYQVVHISRNGKISNEYGNFFYYSRGLDMDFKIQGKNLVGGDKKYSLTFQLDEKNVPVQTSNSSNSTYNTTTPHSSVVNNKIENISIPPKSGVYGIYNGHVVSVYKSSDFKIKPNTLNLANNVLSIFSSKKSKTKYTLPGKLSIDDAYNATIVGNSESYLELYYRHKSTPKVYKIDDSGGDYIIEVIPNKKQDELILNQSEALQTNTSAHEHGVMKVTFSNNVEMGRYMMIFENKDTLHDVYVFKVK